MVYIAWYHGVYTLPAVCLSIPPWVYHRPPACGVLPGTLSPAVAVRDEGALGSNSEIIRENEAHRALQSSNV